MFAIVSDSCSSTSVNDLVSRGVSICPLTVTFGTENYRDGIDMTPKEFYRKMAEYAPQGLPKTACPSPGDFSAAFAEALDAGAEGVICITLGRGISGTYNAACVGAERFGKDKVAVLDVRDTVAVEATCIEKALELRDKGVGFAKAAELLQAFCDVSRSYLGFDTLLNILKGRPNADLEAMDSAALKVKPLIYLDNETGAIQACGKERTTKGLLSTGLALVSGYISDHPEHTWRVYLAHGNAPDRADKFKHALVEAGIDVDQGEYGWIGPVIGTYTGEKAVCASICPTDII
jgi:DegV family protein with EDD domain